MILRSNKHKKQEQSKGQKNFAFLNPIYPRHMFKCTFIPLDEICVFVLDIHLHLHGMQYNKQTTTNFTAVSQCTTRCNVNVYIRFIDFSLSFRKTTS